MNEKKNLLDEKMGQLCSSDPSVRSEAVESFIDAEITDNAAEVICSMLTDPDKGVRNSVDITLKSNPSAVVARHLVKFISSKDLAIKNLAGDILLSIGKEAVPAILNYMKHAGNGDKKFLIDLLGLIGYNKSGGDVLAMLKETGDENIILACIEALGNLQFEDSINYLMTIYNDSELYKASIVEALGKIGSGLALEFISSKYENEDELTRFAIIESMGILGNESTFYFLLSELNKTEGPLVWPIIGALYLLKEKFRLDIPFDEKMKNAILQTITSAESKYKIAASHLISEFDDPEIISACLRLFDDDKEFEEAIRSKFIDNPDIIYKNAVDLVKHGAHNLKGLLSIIKEIKEGNSDSDKESLSDLQLRYITESFAKCLDDPDEDVRRLAQELLFLFDEETAVLFLDKMAEDDNLWNRLKLIDLISDIQNKDSDRILLKLSGDPEEMVCERAEFILSHRPFTQYETKAENSL